MLSNFICYRTFLFLVLIFYCNSIDLIAIKLSTLLSHFINKTIPHTHLFKSFDNEVVI